MKCVNKLKPLDNKNCIFPFYDIFPSHLEENSDKAEQFARLQYQFPLRRPRDETARGQIFIAGNKILQIILKESDTALHTPTHGLASSY